MRKIVVLLAAVAFTQAACFGSFAATRALYRFNAGIGDKWVNWAVFLGLNIIPVYSLFTLGDVLIFNSIEFWGGDNPIADADGPAEREVMLADGSVVRLVREADGLRIEHGDQIYRFARTADGFEMRDGEGTLLSSVSELGDGSVVVRDGEGRSRIVSAAELAEAGQTPESITAWTLAQSWTN